MTDFKDYEVGTTAGGKVKINLLDLPVKDNGGADAKINLGDYIKPVIFNDDVVIDGNQMPVSDAVVELHKASKDSTDICKDVLTNVKNAANQVAQIYTTVDGSHNLLTTVDKEQKEIAKQVKDLEISQQTFNAEIKKQIVDIETEQKSFDARITKHVLDVSNNLQNTIDFSMKQDVVDPIMDMLKKLMEDNKDFKNEIVELRKEVIRLNDVVDKLQNGPVHVTTAPTTTGGSTSSATPSSSSPILPSTGKIKIDESNIAKLFNKGTLVRGEDKQGQGTFIGGYEIGQNNTTIFVCLGRRYVEFSKDKYEL